MSRERHSWRLTDLRDTFTRLVSASLPRADEPDYRLTESIGESYAAVTRAGFPALVLPLAEPPTGVARTAAGCILRPAASVEFDFGGRLWRQPAAALECTDIELLDSFSVLAMDVSTRMAEIGVPPKWGDVARLVDEWQALLATPARLSPEGELGLWGEIWFILNASDVDRLLEAWVGPDGAAADFLLADTALEVKASLARLAHYVSQTQVDRPFGDVGAYLLSLWVGVDPTRGKTVGALAAEVLKRSSDPPHALRRLISAGYSPANLQPTEKPFVPLESPLWFSIDAVPRVRAADPGVSHLRYRVELDESRCLDLASERELRGRLGLASSDVTPKVEP